MYVWRIWSFIYIARDNIVAWKTTWKFTLSHLHSNQYFRWLSTLIEEMLPFLMIKGFILIHFETWPIYASFFARRHFGHFQPKKNYSFSRGKRKKTRLWWHGIFARKVRKAHRAIALLMINYSKIQMVYTQTISKLQICFKI